MIYEYKDLKGVIKVGDRVRAVPGKRNPCVQLNNNGSDEQKITRVDDELLYIDKCSHDYEADAFLEIIGQEVTWENLKAGDYIMNKEDSGRRKVLARVDDVVCLSMLVDEEKIVGWWTIAQAKNGFVIEQPKPPKEVCKECGREQE